MTELETPTTEVQETPAPKTAADASDFTEYKKIRAGEQIPAESPEPPKDPTPDAEADADGDHQTTQEKKPKRDRSAEGRISELTAKIRQLEEQLSQRKPETPQAPPPASPAPPPSHDASKPTSNDDPKPRFKDFLAQAKEGEAYEDVQDRFQDELDKWHERQSEKKAQAQREEQQRQEVITRVTKRAEDARAKYPDFEQVTSAVQAAQVTPVLKQFVVEHPAGFDVLYALAKDPTALSTLGSLSPVEQFAKLGYLAHALSQAPEQPQKPNAPPVSKAPAPPRTVSGAANPPPKTLSEAQSFEEYKRLRQGK